MFTTLLCSAGTEMEPLASPRNMKLARAKTFDLFVSQGDDGECIRKVLKGDKGNQVPLTQIIGDNK
jgi:hypothetical protein